MILWLDANDVNGDGSADANSDFTSIGGKLQPIVMGRFIR